VSDGMYFDATGFFVGGGFYQFWITHGGLAIFGYPLSNEFQQADPTAPQGSRTIQVFERAVMEYWPEDVYQPIKLRLVGQDVLDAGIIEVPAAV